MKKNVFIVLLLSLVMLTSCTTQQIIHETINKYYHYDENINISDFEDALVEGIDKADDSVVGISVETAGLVPSNFFGSGVIIKEKKIQENLYEYIVLTNRHVLFDGGRLAKEITVKVGENNFNGQFLQKSDFVDCAFIKFSCYTRYNVAKVANDYQIQKGRFCVAIGNPYDLNLLYNSVTVGNISHPIRKVEEEDFNGKKCMNFYIQHNAEINGGNSGGGLFNINGELIGINTWKFVGDEIEGLNFSIPIHTIRAVYNFQQYFN